MTKTKDRFGISNFGHWNLPFDLAQGGESFDFAQDREPAEPLVEPFDICDLEFLFIQYSNTPILHYFDSFLPPGMTLSWVRS
jgi:hypothetical protein